MRPRYESARDLANERRVAERLKAQRNLDVQKMPISYRLDYALMRDGKVVGFAEIKSRRNEMARYPTLMISLGKVMAAFQLTAATKLPCYLIAEFTDCIAVVNFREQHELGIGGRIDRNDAADVEPCAYYPIARFAIL